MSDEERASGQQPNAGWDITRRRFIYGSAAVVGTAALWRRPLRLRQVQAGSGNPSGFTLVQASAQAHSSGSVTLNLPNAASTKGTLLVATVLSPAASTPFTPPSGTKTAGWQLGKAVTCSGGRIEQWYWANNPGGLYGPSGSGAVFSGGSSQSPSCLGGIAEIASPSGTTQILDTLGQNSGTGSAASMPVTSAGGVFAGSLGVFSQAEFFTSNVPSGYSWTLPAGYSSLADLHNGLASAWSHSWDGDLSAGYQSPSGGFSYTTGSNGWAAAVCCYRAVTVTPIGVVGGEPGNCLDLDPTGQQLVVGGDVEGCWRTANYGDNWQPADYGAILSTQDQISFADIKWSLLETGVLYACTGKTGTGFGAFLASADGGCTWTQRNSTSLMFYGNGTPSPPRPSQENQDADRTVNRLIAQDPAGKYLYVVTANSGVMRSSDKGSTWTQIWPTSSMPSGTYYPRCITISPTNNQELWIGAWASTNSKGTQLGGVWHTTNAQASSPGWNQLGGYTGTVADLKVLGSGSSAYLYAACATNGIYRAQVSSTGALTSLNGGSTYGGPSMNGLDTSKSIWVSLDGYVASGNHQIITGCSGGVQVGSDANYTNIVQLTLPGGATPATYKDLTGPNTVNTQTLPPFGNAWWHAGASWEFWLGGSDSENPHILIDPNNTKNIYVTNSGGFFRSIDGGKSWQLAVTGMPMLAMHCFAIDPNNAAHFVHCGDDYSSIDVNGDPTGNTPGDIVATSPGASLSGSHRESHAVCFDTDPVKTARVYVGLNTAYSQNAGGAVMYRAPSPADSSWTSTGYDTQVSGAPAVTGLIAGRDGSGNRFVVAIAQGQGAYRWNGTTWSLCTENDGNPLPGAGGTVGQITPMTPGSEAGHLYCYDRMQGLYRSTDYGQSWNQIWSGTTSDSRTGWLALNPNVNGEVWVSTDATHPDKGSGLYKLTVTDSTVTVTAFAGVFSAGAAGIAFGPDGSLYVIALPGSSPAPAVTTLYVSSNDGQTWTDWCSGDGSAASYGPPAGQLGISATGWLWATAGEHFGYWDQVPT